MRKQTFAGSALLLAGLAVVAATLITVHGSTQHAFAVNGCADLDGSGGAALTNIWRISTFHLPGGSRAANGGV